MLNIQGLWPMQIKYKLIIAWGFLDSMHKTFKFNRPRKNS